MEEKNNKTNFHNNDEDFLNIVNIQRTYNLKNRIGTRGFLAPEIIFKSKTQGRAVDMWASGVMFLCFLTKRMPVFNLNKFCKITDETIREIQPLIIIYGREKINKIAKKLSIQLYLYFLEVLPYIPEIFNDYTLQNGIEEMIVRTDINEVNFKLIIYRMEKIY